MTLESMIILHFALQKKAVFWGIYFTYFGVIIFENSKVRILQCCFFTFWKALISGIVPSKNGIF